MESLTWPIVLLALFPLFMFLTASLFLFLYLIRFLQTTLLRLQRESLTTTQTLTTQLSSQLSASQAQAQQLAASTVAEMAQLVSQTSTLLGTKDPLAYQMVAGANAFQGDGGTDPYTSSDGEAEADALAGEKAMADALDAIMNLTGAPNVNDYPYPSSSAEGA